MKIDLPITIIFDCQTTDRENLGRAAGHVIGTLRYETGGDGTDAVLFGTYPPPENGDLGEPAQALLTFVSRKADEKIKARTSRSPWDYAVGTEAERTIWQEDADEQHAKNGQFGAGA